MLCKEIRGTISICVVNVHPCTVPKINTKNMQYHYCPVKVDK